MLLVAAAYFQCEKKAKAVIKKTSKTSLFRARMHGEAKLHLHGRIFDSPCEIQCEAMFCMHRRTDVRLVSKSSDAMLQETAHFSARFIKEACHT